VAERKACLRQALVHANVAQPHRAVERAACAATTLLHWGWGQAWVLLNGAALLWAANAIAARLAVDQISPMTLVSLRWLIIFLVLALAIPWRILATFPVLWPQRRLILALAAFGLTGFNVLLYSAAHWASAIDMMLLQSLIPVLVLAGTVAGGERARSLQIGGILLTCIGVAMVATRGHPLEIMSLSVNKGGLLVLLACFFAAWYTLALRQRPQVSPIVFFAALALAAFIVSLPLLAWEVAQGEAFAPTALGWGVMLFTAVGPALCAQVFYLRAVELIGPARVGPYNNLVPIFGALLGMGLLGETIAFYHVAGLVLVLGGVGLCERKAPVRSRLYSQPARSARRPSRLIRQLPTPSAAVDASALVL
jgi:drug/metabolite transporter (DMT)-like permease